MGLFNRAKAAPMPDRRQAPRVRVDRPAQLVMPSGNRKGTLYDLSEEGARFLTQDPPGKGCAAILEWPGHEAYCKVVWSSHDSCGLAFDRMIPRQVVQDASLYPDTERVGTVRQAGFGRRTARPLG